MRKIDIDEIVFGITFSDIQMLAMESIGRELNSREIADFSNGIKFYFKDWDSWLKELIQAECKS